MVVLPAAVNLPLLSTVKVPTCVELPYDPALTVVLDKVVAFPILVTSPVKLALVVTVLAFPFKLAVIVPALKLPLPSLLTIALAVLRSVAAFASNSAA
jgi:hypothetical protein